MGRIPKPVVMNYGGASTSCRLSNCLCHATNSLSNTPSDISSSPRSGRYPSVYIIDLPNSTVNVPESISCSHNPSHIAAGSVNIEPGNVYSSTRVPPKGPNDAPNPPS